VPWQVEGLSGIRSVAVNSTGYGYAIRTDGTLWKWFEQGPGSQVPTQVEGITDVVSVAATSSSVHVVRADGTVWSSGSNHLGLLGVPGPSSVQGWIQVPGLTGMVSITAQNAHVLAVRADGTAVSWGSNTNGVIGDGISPLHLSPTRVPLPCRLTAVSLSEGLPRCQQ
jgi:alpha-tubulin suppressor-like RCC1 family protein